MGTGGWRRAFCTAVRRDPEATEVTRIDSSGNKQQSGRLAALSPTPSPRSCAKLSFFSGGKAAASAPSTPRLALAATATGLRVRTSKSKPPQCETPPASAAATPRSRSPALFHRKAFSMPSSPRSPASRFALFKHLSRSRCRICSQSLKASQETPVFTAECSHAFHFPCIAAHVRSHGGLACPVCSAAWRQAPFLSALHHRDEDAAAVEQGLLAGEVENRNPNRRSSGGASRSASTKGRDRQLGENRVSSSGASAASGKVYDDDEPLLLVSKPNQGGGVRFNPIPEAANEDEHGDDEEETEDLEQEDEFHGLLPTPRSRSPGCVDAGTPRRPRSRAGGVQVTVMQPAALVSEGRRHRNYVVTLKVKAPAIRSAPLLDPARGRAPIDLVTVLDVSQGMTGEKLQMLKRAMRLVVLSLGPADRLSMVAFSAAAGAKRLLPLRRMSRQGQRAARHIVERLVVVGGGASTGGASVGDALRKATKVLEDRRERNPVATIMLLSDAGQQQHQQQHDQEKTKKENKGGSNHSDPKPLHSPRGTGSGDLRPHSLSTTTTSATTTRFAHLEIPIEGAGLGDGAAEPSPKKQSKVPSEDAFIKCVGGLVSVVMQDVRLQLVFPSGEIAAVYPCGGGGGCCEVALGQGGSVLRLGDLYAEEEREMLVELRVPASAAGPQNGHHHLSVRCNHRDPATHELAFGEEQILHLPPLLQHHPELGRAGTSAACSTTALRLRNTFVSTRAVAESRRLAELADYATAQHLLTSARALLLQSAPDVNGQDHHLVHSLDAELTELQRRRRCLSQQQLHHDQRQEEYLSPSVRRQRREAPAEARGEPLTPTSAWRAAEQLAKVAIMRKSLNRVSDLHGFENARF